jgi:hypothetical protein
MKMNLHRIAAAFVAESLTINIAAESWIRLDHKCFLATDVTLFKSRNGNNRLKNDKGVYLFWDNLLRAWIRSGAVFGKVKTFSTRWEEHLKGAKERRSLFYEYYPSDKVRENDDEFARGTFESLKYFVAFSSNSIKNLSTKPEWPKKFQGMDNENEWKFTDATYALELCAQLLMNPLTVVSESQGFEKRFRGKLNEAPNDILADI